MLFFVASMRRALIQLHIAVFLWGFTGVLGRLITLNEGLLVWYRLLLTVITLLFIMWWQKSFKLLNWKDTLQLFGIGTIVMLHWVCFYGSIKYANVSIALTCLSASGLFTAVLEPLFFKNRIQLVEIVLGAIAIAGIYLIFHFDPRYKIGIIIGLFATLFTAVFSVMNKKIIHKYSGKTMIVYELTGGWLLLTLLMPWYLQQFPVDSILPTTQDWGWLLLLSWFCTILAMELSLKALQKISAFTQNLTLNLEPVYGIILAFVVYQENKQLNDWFYAGFGLILLVVVLQMGRIIVIQRKGKA
jgi:drug/metabolite transporter (DMT)-like permease